MAADVFSCVICGWDLAAPPGEQSWALEFRGVFQGPDGVHLTGVGNHVPEDQLRAPRAFEARWDDSEHSVAEDVTFGAVRQSPVDGRYGFVFHESCWRVLKAAAHPSPVVPQRLYDVCRSIPMAFGVQGLDWGHAYGGLLYRHDSGLFPWERWRRNRGHPGLEDLFGFDPSAIPELDSIMTEPPQSPPRASSPVKPTTRDIFGRLPPELCDMIASHLPTSDALCLRLASKTFHHLFESQQFWATRFAMGGERSWFFETQQTRQHDWRWLFRRTKVCSSALRDRQRVWSLSRQLVKILELQEPSGQLGNVDLPEGAATAALWNPPTPRPGTHPSSVFNHGCRALYGQHQRIPDDLTSISAYTVLVGDTCFIAGLEFHSSGPSRRLGYKSDTKEVLHISRIFCFVLAIGSRGIQAIQCVSPSQHHKWLGSPAGVPRTARLAASSSPIVGVKAVFDGCKLLGMAVDRTGDQPTLRDSPHSMIWYPDLPDPSWIVNEPSLIKKDNYPPAYQPLYWSHFGGANGSSLSRLSRIESNRNFTRMDFFYDGSKIPSDSLGCEEFESDGPPNIFIINGPSGERINQVEVGRNALDEYDVYIFSVKVTTNRQRFHRFGRAPDPSRGEAFRVLQVARGSTVTGLYAHQPTPELGRGFTGLGVISERLTQGTTVAGDEQ